MEFQVAKELVSSATAWIGQHGVAQSLLAAAGVSLAGAVISLLLRTKLLHDMFGSLAFITAVFASLAAGGTAPLSSGAASEGSAAAGWAYRWRPSRQLLASGMVVLWALRLGGYLCYRSFRYGADSRTKPGAPGLDQRRPAWLLMWLMQALVWIWPTVLPVVLLNQLPAELHMRMPRAPAFLLGSPWHAVLQHWAMLKQVLGQAAKELARSQSSSTFWAELLLQLPGRAAGIAADPVSLQGASEAAAVGVEPAGTIEAPAAMAAVVLLLWAAADAAGLLLYVVGSALEVAADMQKLRFKADHHNKGRFITSGLWRYSRHPNYFGEMLLWWGVYLVCLPGLVQAPWAAMLGLLGPVSVMLLLRFVSGVPPLEEAGRKRWGGQADWQEYCRSTSLLVPWPRRRGTMARHKQD